MKRLVKWAAIILGVLTLVVVVAGAALGMAATSRLARTHDVVSPPLTIPDDPVSLARGEELVSLHCQSCHGPDLAGGPVFSDPAIGTINGSNITGLGSSRTSDELVLAIRHGLAPDGRQLIVMPAETFIHFSAEDLGAVIAYLQTVPRSGHDQPGPQLTVLGRALLSAGVFGDLFPAEYIDHAQPFPAMPEIGANAAYGEYLSRFCQACHGEDLGGGSSLEPGAPPAPGLTPAGALGQWSEADFFRAMQTGMTPDGRQLDANFMPWTSLRKLDDGELRGLWLYLQSLPPVQTTEEDHINGNVRE
jgi:mono/diheme cytochrome c family protein